MIFTELPFAFFFVVVFALAWSARSHRAHKLVLLVASYAFYAAWDWRFLSLILLSTGVDFVLGRKLDVTAEQKHRKLLLATSLVLNLGLLGVFKYFGFFVDSAHALTELIGLPIAKPHLALILPVGISFYTFQTLSYTIDVYRREMPACHEWVDFAVFVAFFPQLVAGPIVRARTFLPQLTRRPAFSDVALRRSLLLFGVGFFKKAVVADQLAVVVDGVFGLPTAHTPGASWLGAVLYTIQIYCDFSGYTDMALGCAGLLGYELTRNFDAPFVSTSIRDFWRRWHISLSTWFRDYLYIGLGGNRGGAARTAFNLLAVFVLCGLWHGAAWTFVVWGLIHGAGIATERLLFRRPDSPVPAFIGWVYTTLVVVLAFVVFRAPDLSSALIMFKNMAGGGIGWSSVNPAWWFAVVAFVALHFAWARWPIQAQLERLPPHWFALMYGAAAALVLPWVQAGYRPFIYFQF